MKRYSSIVLLFALAAVLVWGVVQLIALRFDAGDVYPLYSSLRSDPLGTMAFFESLQRSPGLTVKRDLSATRQLPASADTTYFHIATSTSQWRDGSEEVFAAVEQFVATGGRLVVTLLPEFSRSTRPLARPDPPVDTKTKPKPTPVRDRWMVGFEVINLEKNQDSYSPVPVVIEGRLPLPEKLDWHSGIVFTDFGPEWKPIYTRNGKPVMMERSFGSGVLIMASDSYFLSNEALYGNRHVDLLAWLVGSNRTVVFDEAHLGVTERPGVAALMRKYRLGWFLAALVVLSALFVWQMAVPLVPPHRELKVRSYVEGKDSTAGFVNLLRRSIPSGELLATSFQEWRKSVSQSGKYSNVRIQHAEVAFERENSRPPKDRDPVQAWRAISQTLQTRLK